MRKTARRDRDLPVPSRSHSTHINTNIREDPALLDMTPLQHAPITDVKVSSVNLDEEDPRRPFLKGNAASQRFHHTQEDGLPHASNPGVGDAPESRSSMLISPTASKNQPDNHVTLSNNSQSTAHTGTTPPTPSSAPSSQNHPPSIDRMTQLNTMSEEASIREPSIPRTIESITYSYDTDESDDCKLGGTNPWSWPEAYSKWADKTVKLEFTYQPG
ncbi:hypothetical protein MMC16_007308 [Acarospora aff. strigata]|nr:hypothetical protein [Acarospora aff. strigata]